MSNRELVKPYEPESADLFSNIRIFDKLVTNVWHQTLVCQTQIRISRYSSNPNPGFGSRIFDLAFTEVFPPRVTNINHFSVKEISKNRISCTEPKFSMIPP